jgi:hypothetical protein
MHAVLLNTTIDPERAGEAQSLLGTDVVPNNVISAPLLTRRASSRSGEWMRLGADMSPSGNLMAVPETGRLSVHLG